MFNFRSTGCFRIHCYHCFFHFILLHGENLLDIFSKSFSEFTTSVMYRENREDGHNIYPLRENRENGKKNPCQGKQREFGNIVKTQGILYAQVVNSLILGSREML